MQAVSDFYQQMRHIAVALTCVVAVTALAACTPSPRESPDPTDPTSAQHQATTHITHGAGRLTVVESDKAQTALNGRQFSVIQEYSGGDGEDFSAAQLTEDGDIVALARDTASETGSRSVGRVDSGNYQQIADTTVFWGGQFHEVVAVSTTSETTAWLENTGSDGFAGTDAWKLFMLHDGVVREVASSQENLPDVTSPDFGDLVVATSEDGTRFTLAITGETAPPDGGSRHKRSYLIEGLVDPLMWEEPAQRTTLAVHDLGQTQLASVVQDTAWQVQSSSENGVTTFAVSSTDLTSDSPEPVQRLVYEPGVRVHHHIVSDGSMIAVRASMGGETWIDIMTPQTMDITRVLLDSAPADIALCDGLLAWTSPAADDRSSPVFIFTTDTGTLWSTDVSDNLGSIACRDGYIMWQAMDASVDQGATAVVVAWQE